jgi:carboxylesterase
MITTDNEREVVARECALFLRESAAASTASNNPTPVVSRALARRLRQLANVADKA